MQLDCFVIYLFLMKVSIDMYYEIRKKAIQTLISNSFTWLPEDPIY